MADVRAPLRQCFFVPVKQHSFIDREVWDRYWSDIHGPIASRLPGIEDYLQLRLAALAPGMWTGLGRVDFTIGQNQRWDGLAELTFRNCQSLETWLASTAVLSPDEKNLFSRTVAYFGIAGADRTFIDAGGPPHNGPDTRFNLQLLLSARTAADRESLHRILLQDVTPRWAEAATVRSLRVIPLAEHDNDATTPGAAQGADSFEPADLQHHASISIGFEDRLDCKQFLESRSYLATTALLDESVGRMHVHRVTAAFQCVKNGELTLIGTHGATSARVIGDVGATNVLAREVRALLGVPTDESLRVGA